MIKSFRKTTKQSLINKELLMKNLINVTAMAFGLLQPYIALSTAEINLEQSGTVDKYYVGPDNDCEYSSIQAAIDAAKNSQNPTEISIARNMGYFENLQIDNNDILLDGSYANCADARNNIHIEGRTILNDESKSGQPTIKVNGLFVHIKSITLINNDQGGIFADATSTITLEDMQFNQLGNALYTIGDGQIDVQIKNTSFVNNTGINGSAISCEPTASNSNHSIAVTDDSNFVNNTASSNGGAIYLTGECNLWVSDSKFQNNNASNGGGIYASNSTSTLKNIIFDSNTVTNDGGAIYAIFFTTINAENIHFINNQSSGSAGAVALLDSDLQLITNPNSCTNNKCNYFNNNKSTFGGAILLQNGSSNISSTYFENNRANLGTALAVYESTVKIEGSVFNNNGNNGTNGYDDMNMFIFGDDANTSISYSTFADNKVLGPTFLHESNSVLNVYSSIIYDTNGNNIFDNSPFSTNDVNCLIVHEDQSFDANNAFVTVTDPMFVDPVNGDYHINSANSPAVDYCTDTIAIAQFSDIDNQSRGYDDPNIPNNPDTNGSYDIGADETYSNDIIFTDGFE